ncbi:MAG: hypothetical protein IIT97_01015, partial [Mycoplasmataceae bacterium]|nr:hypothetical protein [Mycoplasmataceae bacterium]
MELNNEAKEGFFVDKVFNKQKNKYGENQALKIKSRIKEIFNSCEDLMNSHDDNKNVLLIGKVQSGKTSNLEMISAFAFDNKYQCAIIYGGYDNSLLKQTCNRFKETFDIKDVNQIESNTAELFSTNDIYENDINNLDETIIKKLIQKNKPFFLISMKRPDAMNKITKILNCIKKLNIKSFIIDDECDQASLNTKFRKNEESPTYSTIVEMKSLLNNPLYLAVTATPYANVLLSDISELIPNKLFLIHPGDGYTGADFFHLDDDKIIIVSEKDVEQLDEDKIPKSLHNAIFYFLLTSVIIKIKLNKQDNYTDMIINTNRKNQNQGELYKQINQIINTLKNNFSDYITDFEKIYRLYFKKDIIEKYSFGSIKEELKNVIDDTHIVLQNSQGKETMTNLKYYFHKIYIGSNLLQRGLTFSNLIATYFTISPKITNIDTTIQRARWFGYRSEYIDFCKIFTTKKIQQDFVKLTETENDIWEQCKDIENSKLKISEIIINSGDTKFNPTRRNVAAYKKIIRTKRWICQAKGCFDIK